MLGLRSVHVPITYVGTMVIQNPEVLIVELLCLFAEMLIE